MRWIGEYLRRLRVLLERNRFPEELAEEMQTHVEMAAEDNRHNGMDADQARYAALRRFGNPTLLSEAGRDAWGWAWFEAWMRDGRLALRMLRRSPAFATTAVLTLALGIGATTAIFSVAHALLLRSLPVTDPQNLRLLMHSREARNFTLFSLPAYAMLRDQSRSFSSIAAFGTGGSALISTPQGGLERVFREYVSASYFPILGLQPAAGRLFSHEDDDRPSTNVIISHSYWQRRFQGSPTVIGAGIRFGGREHAVIGVAPQGFSGMVSERATEVWFAASSIGPRCVTDSGCMAVGLLARVKPGVPEQQALAEANSIYRRHLGERAAGVAERDRKNLLDSRLELANGGAGVSYLARQYATPLMVLGALAGLVLLLTCANIANMLLARAEARQRELAIRIAIGAGRGRLVRQLLTESLVLALLGGAAGVLVAYGGARALVRNYTDTMIRIDVGPDPGVFAFAAVVSIATGLLFGIVPSLRATRKDVGLALRRRWNARRVLAATQIALSILLLAGAGLFVRTLMELKMADPGFAREHLVKFSISTTTGYPVPGDPSVRRLFDKVRQLPGVIVAATGRPPPHEGPRYRVQVSGFTPVTGSDSEVSLVEAGEGYLEAVGTPLVAGRAIGPEDMASGRVRKAAIVNKLLQNRFFGGASAVGRTFSLVSVDNLSPAPGQTLEIVGTVADARYFHPREQTRPTVFLADSGLGAMMLRVEGDARGLMAALPRFVRESEPSLRVLDVETVAAATSKLLTRERMLAELSGSFAILATLLSSLGIFGVLSYGVARRTREIGIRMALGASRAAVRWSVIHETLLLLAAGLAAGVPAFLLSAHSVTSLLYGVSAVDPATIAGAVTLVAGVALLAGYLPARRASNIAPSEALRQD